MTQLIETVKVDPKKSIPLKLYKELYRISYFMKLMERTSDGKVIWDELKSSIYDDSAAEIEYHLFQMDLMCITFELPKDLVNQLS